MRLRHSASLRLTLLVACAVAAVSLVGLVIVYDQLRQTLFERTEERLNAELSGYSALYDQRRIIAVRQAMEYRQSSDPGFGVVYLLLDKQEQYLGGNLQEWPALVSALADGFAQNPQDIRTLALPDGSDQSYLIAARTLKGGFPVMVGISLAPYEATLTEMRRTIAVLLLAMSMAGILAGLTVARYVFRRLNTINRFLDNVDQKSLEDRLPDTGSEDEYSALALHVNQMLDRIANLHRAHQKLGDVIAHEMRTPLGRIQSLVSKIDTEAPEKEAISEEIRGTIRLFDSLLNIAAMDAQAGSRQGLVPVDLSETGRQMFELFLPVAEEEGRKLTADISSDQWILGDGNLLAQVMSNLLENALKFTAPGDEIRVSVTANKTTVDLRVEDSGPGLPDDVGADVFGPFYRAENTSAKGHGLGLALVRAIALRHGAKLRLPDAKKGFAIEISWPRFDSNS